MHVTVKEMYQVRKAVQEADPESFFVVVESHEVHGEGFKMTNIGEAQAKFTSMMKTLA